MEAASPSALASIGLIAGVLAGLLGLGGGVIIIPLLVFGAGLPMKLATGVSVLQALFAATSGVMIHHRHRAVDARLGIILGTTGVLGGAVGSLGSAALSSGFLLFIYLGLVVTAILLLFFAPREEQAKNYANASILPAMGIGFGIGVLAGMLGVGGGFIIAPVMISVLKVPTKIAVGTSLLMIIPTTMVGAMGKLLTGQIDPQIALYVVGGAIIGAQIGGRISVRLPARAIRLGLLTLLISILLRTGAELLLGGSV